MIKRILIIAIASAALLMGTTMYAEKAQKKEPKEPKGPRIVLEEVEVILKENGKEIERKILRSLKDYEDMRDKVHEEVFKKLGVTSLEEVKKKKLRRQYDKELNKRLVVRKLQHPKLIAVDEKGKVLKEFSLDKEKAKAKLWDEYLKKDLDAEKITEKRAIVSDNKMFGAVGINTVVIPFLTSKSGKVSPFYDGKKYFGKLIVYDNKGEVLFEKKYSEGTTIYGYNDKIRIADNGTVAIITSTGEEGNRLHMYDRSGREILVYPDAESYAMINENPQISPNGKYLSVSPIFFNTVTGARWEADKPYIIREISDSGIIRAGYQNDPEKIIDLKEHLGD
jgi:hypothetical protein